MAYDITLLGFPGASETSIADINELGEIVGNYTVSPGISAGFTDIGGMILSLTMPNASSTVITAVNNQGEVIGFYGASGIDASASPASGFIEKNGSFQTVVAPNAVRTTLVAVNNAGVAVGNDREASNIDTDHAFMVNQKGQIASLDAPGADSTTVTDINDAGVTIGHLHSPTSIGEQGFIYRNGTFTPFNDPNAADGTIPLAINNRGDIAGEYFTSDGAEHGFLEAQGKFTTLDPLTQVRDLAIQDIVVGSNLFSTLPLVSSQGITSLVLNPASTGGGPFFTGGTGINSSGTIVGDANRFGFVATPQA